MSDPVAPTPPPGAPSEPLLPVASLIAVASAVLDALVAFGLHLTSDQKAGVIAVISAAAPIAVWAWGRRRVYSPATVRRMMVRGHEPGV